MAATSVTEVYDALLTTTARHMNGEIRDNITRSNKYVAWLRGNGRERTVSGGERIQVPLMFEQNQGADIYQGFGILDTTPAEGITSAFFPWAQMSVPITISGLEERSNSGPEMIKNLLRTKETQSQASAIELQNNCVTAGRIASGATGSLNQFSARVGTLDSSAVGPLPLAALVDANPSRSVSVGSINGGTETFWRNQATAFTATTYLGFKQELNNLYNNCSRGAGGPPDLALADQRAWELYFNSLHTLERYQVTSERVINILGGAGEDMLKFRNAVMVWDEVVPDVGTSTANIVDSIGTSNQSGAHSTIYLLNSESLEYIVHPAANWTHSAFVKPVNGDMRVAHLLWQGQVVVNNRRKNGIGYDLDNSITS